MRAMDTIELGWTGATGYCANTGLYGLIRSKPNFTFTFDALMYSSDEQVLDFKILNRMPFGLSPEEVAEIELYAKTHAVNPPTENPDVPLPADLLAWYGIRKDDPRFTAVLAELTNANATKLTEIVNTVEPWFNEREKDPRLTLEDLAKMIEFDIWYKVRKADPRFKQEVQDWWTERKDDPRFDGTGGGGSTPLPAGLEAWFTARKDDPQFTAQFSAWLEARKDDPRFTQALQTWYENVKTDPRYTIEAAVWYQERKNDPRYTGQSGGTTPLPAGLEAWYQERKGDPRYTGQSGGGTSASLPALYVSTLKTEHLTKSHTIIFNGFKAQAVPLPNIVAATTSPREGLDVQAGKPITLKNRGGVGASITLSDDVYGYIYLGSVMPEWDITVEVGEVIVFMPAIVAGEPFWEVTRKSETEIHSLSSEMYSWLSQAKGVIECWTAPQGTISQGFTRGKMVRHSSGQLTAAAIAATSTVYNSNSTVTSYIMPFIVWNDRPAKSGEVHAGYRVEIFNASAVHMSGQNVTKVRSMENATLNEGSGQYGYRIPAKTKVTLEAYDGTQWYLIKSEPI